MNFYSNWIFHLFFIFSGQSTGEQDKQTNISNKEKFSNEGSSKLNIPTKYIERIEATLVAMESNMVEENGNSSLDPLGGESASTHNNSDETSAQQSQHNTSSLHHHHQNASPSAAVLATSNNIVQFIPAQSVQVSSFTIIITHTIPQYRILNTHDSILAIYMLIPKKSNYYQKLWKIIK